MTPSIVAIVGALLILLTLFELLRRHRLREKYALLWFLIAIAALVVTVVPGLLTGLTDLFGIALPVNLAFFAGSLVLFLMTMQHSSELGRLEERTRALAEEVAVLRLELDQARHPDPAATDEPHTDGSDGATP